MSDVYLSVIYQFKNAVLPFPAQPFCIQKHETPTQIARRMDAFALDIADAYRDRDTAALIRAMYLEGYNVSMKQGLLSEGMLASHRRSTGALEPEHSVSLDACFEQCPLLKRIFLMHEIAIHVGQFRARALDIRNALGLVTLDMVDTPHYRHFTEMTAACIDKLLLDAIPMQCFEEETQRVEDAHARRVLQSIVTHYRQCGFRDFMHLHHRREFPDGQLSAREIRLFEAREEVIRFMKDTYPKSVYRT